MRILIWSLTLLVGTIVNTLLGQLVGLSEFLLYLLEIYIAHKLCLSWDAHQFYKQNPEKKESEYSKRLAQISSLSETRVEDSAVPAQSEAEDSANNM